jgi:ribulose-5-phosphate 4-epimerase/fuculose-1-phosphate aldolase
MVGVALIAAPGGTAISPRAAGEARVVAETPGGDLAAGIVEACRVMAERGLVEHVLGHISARISERELLIRCRGPHEAGLAYTAAADVHPVRLDDPIDGIVRDLGGWTPPNELPIHTEVLRRRPEVTAVVHAHPPAVVQLSLVGAPLLPIYGAYDIPGARLAAAGVPTWPRSILVTTARLGAELADALGSAPVLILRGHGLVSVGTGAPEVAVRLAVLQAIAVDTLARTTLTVLAAGGSVRAIADDDLAGLPDLGGGFNVETMWRFLVRELPATS